MYTLVASKRDQQASLMAEYLVNRIGFIRNENISYRSQNANHLRNHESLVAKENCAPMIRTFANMELYVSQ